MEPLTSHPLSRPTAGCAERATNLVRRHIVALSVCLVTLPLAAGAGPLNDTGSEICRAHSSSVDTTITSSTTCQPLPTHGGQDARFGRDAAASMGMLPKVGSGRAGFDFTKFANGGARLPSYVALGPGPMDWACTFDNNTGLMWEVKTTAGLRNAQHIYSWYDEVHNYGGTPGTAGGGYCETTGRCDTEKFVADVNAAGLCGHNDWRLPTLDELFGLVDLGPIPTAFTYSTGPAIDEQAFPNTQPSEYWTSVPQARAPDYMWSVSFGDGSVSSSPNFSLARIRLVRNGQ
jgi:hypothetical protein